MDTKRRERSGPPVVPPPSPPRRPRDERAHEESARAALEMDLIPRAPVAATADEPITTRLARRDLDRLLRFFRIPRVRRLPKELRPRSVGALALALPRGTYDPGFRVLLQRIDESPMLDGNGVQIFFGPAGAFDAMRRAIESAREEILVELYVLADAAGRRLADLLVKARARGVSVRVLADASDRGDGTPFWEPLRKSGVELRLFQPFFKSPWYQPRRDHRKLLIVDRCVAFTGGREPRVPAPGSPALAEVTLRVEGRTALEMSVVFSEGWDRASGRGLEIDPVDPSPGHEADGASILVLDSPPWRLWRRPSSALMAIVESARKSLWISNPSAPKEFVLDALARAAARGVDVRILVPESTHGPMSRSARRGSYPELLRRGISIWEYPGDGLDAKVMIVDDYVSVVGSTNLDVRTFSLDAQCSLVILESATARTLAAAFERDLASARRVTAASVSRRPILSRAADELARELVTAL